jgi:hypothetical protein
LALYFSLQWDNGGSLIGFGRVPLKGGVETTLCEEASNVIEVVKFSCILVF